MLSQPSFSQHLDKLSMRYGLGLGDEPFERDRNLSKANSVQLRSSSHGQAPLVQTSPIRSMVDHGINLSSFG
jgi:hypothetical protein